MSFTTLHDDVLEIILENLDCRSLCRVSSVNRYFREFVKNHASLQNEVSLAIETYDQLVSFALWIQQRNRVKSLELSLEWPASRKGLDVLNCIVALCSGTLEKLVLCVDGMMKNPAFVDLLTNVRYLQISSNGLFIGNLKNSIKLETLRVSSRSWNSHVRFNCTGLRTVQLKASGLREVPTALTQLPFLKTLELDYNPLSTDFPALANLEEVSMKGCCFLRVPDLSKCPMLRRIDLSRNSLSRWHEPEIETPLFDPILELHHLEHLDVSHNALNEASVEELGRLVRRPAYLDISGNCFGEPAWGKYMDGVETLVVSSSPSRDFLKRCVTLRKVHIHICDGICCPLGDPDSGDRDETRWWLGLAEH